MTEPVTVTPPGDAPGERRLSRRLDRAWVAGVCAGLADHLGVSAVVFRVLFVVLSAWRLTGVAAYLVLWLLIPHAGRAGVAPGLDAAAHRGLRPAQPARTRGADVGQAVALGLIGGGLLWLVQGAGWGLDSRWLVAGCLGGAGAALVWWQADHASAGRGRAASGWRRWLAPLVAHWTTVLALGAGIAAVASALWITMATLPDLGVLTGILVAVALALGALILLAAPWVLRARAALVQAREEKLLADARADMAAHLHDSVLQTLALIQRQAGDARAVARLARRQERELREWLYGVAEQADTLRAALLEAAQEVEDDFPVTVECVTVGDTPLTPALAELVKATREAMVNAAKHSGAPVVDVYAEVGDASVEVFVRDRGRGFDPAAIGEDRMGVRGSIIDRMRRHHGTARIRSHPDRGTEVTLEMRP